MVSGMLPVIKPAGPSSAAIVGHIKRLTRAQRVGHAGTLDPAAEGVLVLAFNRATPMIPYLPKKKAYRALVRLGIETDSLDAQGKIRKVSPVPILSEAEVASALDRFVGKSMQKPPLVSARHYQGRRLYQLAREGHSVELCPTPIDIHSIRLCSIQLPDIMFDIDCSRGTYIRSLARDVGELLGCGAHLNHLTRTACSGFSLEESLTLEKVAELVGQDRLEEHIIPPAQALRHLPRWPLEDQAQQVVQNGRALPLPESWDETQKGPYRIMDAHGCLLAIATPRDGWLKMKRVLCSAQTVKP